MRTQEYSTPEELYDRIWKTKSARFNAYQRLTKTQLLSSYATNLLSVYVIVLSLLQPFQIINEDSLIKIFNFATICVSVLLLVFVLMESSMQYNLKAEKFHDCAKSISKLFKKFEFVKGNSDIEERDKYLKYLKIQKQYNQIIDLYENHRAIDFKYFQSNNKLKEYQDKTFRLSSKLNLKYNFKRWYIKQKYNHLIYLHYYFVIFIIPLVLIYLMIINN